MVAARLPSLSPAAAAKPAAIGGARPNTRRVARESVRREVLVATATGSSAKATIRDMSIYGCSLAHSADWLRLGRFVSIKVDEKRTFQAVVRWTRDGLSGAEFLRPLGENQIADLVEADD